MRCVLEDGSWAEHACSVKHHDQHRSGLQTQKQLRKWKAQHPLMLCNAQLASSIEVPCKKTT
jgi:hypothetical protein